MKAKRGFAVIDHALALSIQRRGGKAVSRGPKGRDHMRELGSKGGTVTQQRIRELRKGNQQ